MIFGRSAIKMSKSEKQFLLLWLGETISSLGSALVGFGVMVWVYRIHGDPSQLGYLAFSYLGPQIYFSLFAGHLIDYFNRKTLLVLSDFCQLLLSVFLLVVLSDLGQSTPFWLILTINLLAGAFSAIQYLIFLSSTVLFVPKNRLLKYNGLMQAFNAGPKVLAPLLALPLLSLIDLKGLLLLDLATFIVALLFIIPVKFPLLNQSPRRGFKKSQFFEGFSQIKKNVDLMCSLRFFVSVNFVGGLAMGVLTAFIIEKAGADSIWVAYNSSLAAFGVFVGGFLVLKWAKKMKSPFVIMGWTMFVAAVLGRIGVSLISVSWLIGAFLLVRNSLIPILNSCNDTIWQSNVDPSLQGRVFGARRFVAQGALPIALLIGASLSKTLESTAVGGFLGGGTSALFLICGILEIMSLVLLLKREKSVLKETQISNLTL